MSHRRHSLHCLLPPIVLEHIVRNGDDDQRAWAVGALDHDHTIRLARVQNAKLRGRGPREGADFMAVASEVVPNRVIRTAEGTENVDGQVTRSEGDGPADDEATNEAYDGLGDTFAFWFHAYDRNSIDDAGMPLRGVVHFGDRYPNAFWDGRRMVFGDGDGRILGPMTKSLDVIGHELGHGVTETEAGLEYFAQPGALNESMSDVFGSLVKQHKNNQKADQADWLIGSEVWTPAISGDALRSMKAPGTAYDDPLVGKDPQPAHMRDYLDTNRDSGGVHLNSGIPNHTFYLVATGLGGYAWENAGRIWYEALRSPECGTQTNFPKFAKITVSVAERLHGRASKESNTVRDAWEQVGLTA